MKLCRATKKKKKSGDGGGACKACFQTILVGHCQHYKFNGAKELRVELYVTEGKDRPCSRLAKAN